MSVRTQKPDRSEQFALYLRAERIGGWEREYRFHPTRKWRFDFAWPNTRLPGDFKLAVEIEGITRFGRRRGECKSCGAPVPGEMIIGRHQTAKGMEADCEKYHSALDLGWIVFRVTQTRMAMPETFETIRLLIGQGGEMPPEQAGLELPNHPEF